MRRSRRAPTPLAAEAIEQEGAPGAKVEQAQAWSRTSGQPVPPRRDGTADFGGGLYRVQVPVVDDVTLELAELRECAVEAA